MNPNFISGAQLYIDVEQFGCTQIDACNYSPDASVEDGTCQFPESFCGNVWMDCECNCFSDFDGDGVCDQDEEPGCLDAFACNYNISATDDDGSCTYSSLCFDCHSNCWDLNENGICDCDEILGCMEPTACNFSSLANVEDGNCEFAVAGYDCAGGCLLDEDADGICDEQDTCPLDADNDIDQDGYCADEEIWGCVDPTACNYQSSATEDDGSCVLISEVEAQAFANGYASGYTQGFLDGVQSQPVVSDCVGDLDLSGNVGVEDLLTILSVFGMSCED
jgi:hypothetical protein